MGGTTGTLSSGGWLCQGNRRFRSSRSRAPLCQHWHRSNRDHPNSENTRSRSATRQVPHRHCRGQACQPPGTGTFQTASALGVSGGHKGMQVPSGDRGEGARGCRGGGGGGSRFGHTTSGANILVLVRKPVPALGVSGIPPGSASPSTRKLLPKCRDRPWLSALDPALHAPHPAPPRKPPAHG